METTFSDKYLKQLIQLQKDNNELLKSINSKLFILVEEQRGKAYDFTSDPQIPKEPDPIPVEEWMASELGLSLD